VLGTANLYVMYNHDMDTWVTFKTAGTIGLTLLTAITQAIWIALYMGKGEAKQEGP
jgi:intracellular septation protein A